MIKLKNILNESNVGKDAKILYVKDKNGKYIITPKTLTNFMDKHSITGVNPQIAKEFIKQFDFYAFNQFASTNPTDNIKSDMTVIMKDFLAMYRRW